MATVNYLILHGLGHLVGVVILRSYDQLNTAHIMLLTSLLLDIFTSVI